MASLPTSMADDEGLQVVLNVLPTSIPIFDFPLEKPLGLWTLVCDTPDLHVLSSLALSRSSISTSSHSLEALAIIWSNCLGT